MSLFDQMKERRAALKAELEAVLTAALAEKRSLTDTENADADAKEAEIRSADARIAELAEAEKREAAAAAHHVETAPKPEVRVSVTSEPNPEYRKDRADTSYFKDLFSAQVQGESRARERLVRSQETRALTTVAGAGGQFAPPAWLVSDFVALARPGRVTADLMQHEELPSGVSSINLPKISSGTTTAIQVTQNSALSQTDLVSTSVSSNISTIGGKQIVSLQLLNQSGIPFDRVILEDLAADYAKQLDVQVITGSGVSGQLRGLQNGASVGATTFTSASPAVTTATAANSFYNKVVSAVNSVYTTRFQSPTAIVMHPQRWSWVLEALDSANRPLVTPNAAIGSLNQPGADGPSMAQGLTGTLLGLPVYVDPNVPVNVGGSQDIVIVLRQSDCWLYETPVQMASFDATYADQASILFRVLGYAAFIPDRFGASVNIISGTGLITPTL